MKAIALKYQLIILLGVLLASNIFAQRLVINEVMYANHDVHFDADNDSPDWIELYNGGNQIINLKGYQLTDDTTETEHWIFPDYSIEAGAFLIVFASAVF